jgi:hypothetical protein
MSIPYDDIDPPIRPLVGFLNERLGVVTVASYGGHENPDEGQAPEGGWWVLVRVPEAPAEWDAFEFLAWVCRDWARAGKHLVLEADASPPWLNKWVTGDSTLGFVLSGDTPPGELADFMRETLDAIEARPPGGDDE